MNKVRKELDKLKRENSRLRKLLRRFADRSDAEVEEVFAQEDKQVRSEKKKEQKIESTCPKCGCQVKQLDLGTIRYRICDDCGFRQKLQ